MHQIRTLLGDLEHGRARLEEVRHGRRTTSRSVFARLYRLESVLRALIGRVKRR